MSSRSEFESASGHFNPLAAAVVCTWQTREVFLVILRDYFPGPGMNLMVV